MQFQYTPYSLLLIASALAAGGVAAYAWKRRAVLEVAAMLWLALAIAEWLLCYALEIAGADLPTKVLWGSLSYVGIVSVPVLWFIFTLYHSNRGHWLTRRNLIILSVVPFITLVLALTFQWQGLIWSEYHLETGPFLALVVSHGFWFWVHSTYSYTLILLGAVFVVQSLRHTQGLYRGQVIALLIAVAAPWIGNALYLTGLSPVQNLDLTPFAFTITILALAWGILGFRLTDLSPIARDLVVEEMSDGMIVVDTHGRIADINPAAQQLIGLTAAQTIGQPVTEALSAWPHLTARYNDTLEARDEIAIGEGETQRWYELRLSPLNDQRRRHLGRVIAVRDITARKQAEDKLAQERNLLRTVIDYVPDQIFVRDTVGRFVLCNLADAQTMGVSDPDTLLGKTDFDVYPAELAAQYQADDLIVMQRDEPIINREEQAGEVNGQPRWVLTTKVPLRDPQGQVSGLVGIARDVTERKRSEGFKQRFLDDMKALQELQLSLSEIEQLETLYIQMIDLTQQRLGLDRVGLFLLDEKKHELVGTYGVDQTGQHRDERYYREPITSDHWTLEILNAPKHTKLWEEAPLFDNGQVIGTGWKAATALWNGRQAIGYLVCDNFLQRKPARPYEAELISLLGNTFGHLIERKRAEEQIRQLSRAVEASPTSIVITDTQGQIQYVNPKFTEVTGYTFREALGQNPRILKTDQTQPGTHQQMWQAITSGQEWHGEFCNRKKNGELYWEWASISPIINVTGEITHYVAVKEDITDRKRAQEELALARDQALEASRYKSELVAKVSHELRTPLGAIIGYAEFLHAETFAPLTAQQKHFAAEIIDSAQYLSGLVNDLLDQSQIERGVIEIQLAPFEPRHMVAQLAVTLQPQAEIKKLNFATEIDPTLPQTIMSDHKRVRQILINLAGNAIKFTEAGSVIIRVSRRDAQHWAMQVTDTGPGMPAEVLSKIFDSFWQVDGSLTRRQKGYGLGLSIVKQLVERLNGEVRVESEVGQGSTFTVILPLNA